MARNALDIACFEANGNTYGVDVMGLREIVHDAEVTPLPQAPKGIEGIVDLAGRVLPVFDLGLALGGGAVEQCEESRIAVLVHGGVALGMRVDAAVDVMNVEFSELQAPEAAVGGGAGVVVSIVRRDSEPPVMVLDLAALLGSVGVNAFGAADGTGDGSDAGAGTGSPCEEVEAA